MSSNPLKRLGALGQFIWQDYIKRGLVASGELRRLIEDDGLLGMPPHQSNCEAPRLTERAAWNALEAHSASIRNVHLRQLFVEDPHWGERLTAEAREPA